LIRTAARTRRAQSAHHPTAVNAAEVTASKGKTCYFAAAMMGVLGLLTACGAPNLKPDVPAGVSLAGSWRLNRQASADPEAMITAIVEKEMKHMRRGSHAYDEDDPDLPPPGATGRGGPGRGAAENVVPPGGMFRPRGGMAKYLRSQYTNALGSILGGDGLVIEQSAERFTLRRGDSRRTFTPGGHSVIGVTDGVADQTTGWKGREYVIDVRPQVGPHVTERYGLGPEGQLIEKVELSGDGLRKLEFTRVYDKGALPPRALPNS
jgi:hypothetical protein